MATTDDGMIEGFGASLRGLATIPLVRQMLIILGFTISIALGASLVMWVQEPSYRPLFTNLSMEGASSVTDVLQQSGIPFKLDAQNGTVMIPADMFFQARMKLAAAGVPKTAGHGMGAFEQQSGFGVSRFVEDVRYKLALEEELARTIETIEGVKSARVHLALPKQSSFLTDNAKPSASIMVTLSSGYTLDKSQVSAIAQMLASSVSGLSIDNVTIADQRGELLSNDLSGDMAVTKEQFEYQQKLQKAYEKRIESIVMPMVGADGVHARVSADIDYTNAETTNENFNPKDKIIRSEQTLTEQSSGGGQSGGAPGALSNQPPGGAGGAGGGGGGSKNQSIKNYDISKTITYSKNIDGKILRLTIAVVINDRISVDPANGQQKRMPLTADEITKVTSLVKDAVGFDDKRGDRLSIVNSRFAPPIPQEVLPPLPVWKQPWFWEVIKKVVGTIIGLIVIFSIVRPVMRTLAKKAPTAAEQGGGQQGGGPAGLLTGGMPSANNSVATGAMLAEIAELKRKQIESIQHMVSDNPARAATVLKSWVGGGKA